MQLVRPFLLALLFLCQNAAITAAAEINGEGRLITHSEAQHVIKRYRSIPGAGVVKGEGRLITHGEAADVVKRYRSIPGGGVVKGEGRLITHGEAADVVKRYRSIPGAGVVKGEGRLITHGEAADVVRRYRSIPGGLILEGTALGLEWVKTVRYEPTLNAFVLNGLVVYPSPIPSHSAAILARAIAEDDRIGVSLTEESQIVYGRLPGSSDVATDLKLADGFLGDLILPPREWTIGYRLAEGFVPRDDVGDANATVFFRFRDFQFATKDKKLELERAHFDARVVAALDKRAADGGYLPDLKAISSGALAAYEVNAKHVGANISYYLQEKIVARVLGYGEVSAFFRALKASGIDLRDLVRGIDVTSAKATAARASALEKLEGDWAAYLIEIQAAKAHANWSAPPYDLYVDRTKTASARKSRATTPSEAKSKPIAADPAVADCLLLWSRDTHMTKQEWSRTCQRAKDRVSGS